MGLAWTVIALSLLHASSSIEWCDETLDCEVPNGPQILTLKNTLCQNSEHESIHHCHSMAKRPTSSVKQTLSAMHNTFRDRVAGGTVLPGWPTASNMRQMSWDDSLAEQALRWAFQCDDKAQDPCRTHPVYKENEGQILGVVIQSSTIATPDIEHVFRKWIREALKAKASPAIVADEECLHLAEIIFSGAHKIGCGVIDYQDDSGRKAIRIVCNYDVEYLMEDSLYKPGQNCTDCPDTSCKLDSTYKHLCALGSDPVDEEPLVVEFDGQEPMEPVVTAPMEPVVTAPMEPVVTAQMEPVVTAPMEPMVTAPMEPMVTAPMEPVVTTPMEPVVTAPMEPVVTAQMEPVVTADEITIVSKQSPQPTTSIRAETESKPRVNTTVSVSSISQRVPTKMSTFQPQDSGQGALRGYPTVLTCSLMALLFICRVW